NSLIVRPVEESTPGQLQLGNGSSFDLGQPVRRVVVLPPATGAGSALDAADGGRSKLFVIFGEGEKGGVFKFDGAKAPVLTQTIIATNELLTCVASVPGGILAFSQPANGKFSMRYYAYNAAGPSTYSFTVFGSLPSLADND